MRKAIRTEFCERKYTKNKSSYKYTALFFFYVLLEGTFVFTWYVHVLKYMRNKIGFICSTFWPVSVVFVFSQLCVSKNVFLNCLLKRKHSNICSISSRFSYYVSFQMSPQRTDKGSCIVTLVALVGFSPPCVFKCLFKSPA